jgi:hypothetical protein
MCELNNKQTNFILKLTDKNMSNQSQPDQETNKEIKEEEILCNHCLRTANNGIKCRGICVADSGY